jgi:hypothetical protein
MGDGVLQFDALPQVSPSGNLQGDQTIAEPVTPTRHAAAAFVQDGVYVCPGNAQRGCHVDNHGGKQCDEKRIQKNAPIEIELEHDRNIGVHVEVTEGGAAPHAEHHAGHTADQRQGHAFPSNDLNQHLDDP